MELIMKKIKYKFYLYASEALCYIALLKPVPYNAGRFFYNVSDKLLRYVNKHN